MLPGYPVNASGARLFYTLCSGATDTKRALVSYLINGVAHRQYFDLLIVQVCGVALPRHVPQRLVPPQTLRRLAVP